MLNESEAKPFTAEDIRFTRKGNALYAIFLDWPAMESTIRSLGASSGGGVERIDLLGGPELQFRRDPDALRVALPAPRDGGFVPALRIRGSGLV
jgi:alpha-L-fucosidase